MNSSGKVFRTLDGLLIIFIILSVAFVAELWGRQVPLTPIPLAHPDFTNTATARVSGAELFRTGGDTSGMDCYACHDRKVTPKLNYGAGDTIVLSKEHEDLVMEHGTHHRNNNCFNCHDDTNLEMLQTRDARKLKLVDSTPLCGSCHGPTYRDWTAGAHGRTSGFWNRTLGPAVKQDCVSCHDPHAPDFPPRKPAPGPNYLKPGRPKPSGH